MNARSWFEVDRAGLAKIASRRTKVFILRELIQNAWDAEDSKMITIEVHAPAKGSGFSTVIVADDSPEGFADLAHAYTLFAPSLKVGNTRLRGRFNFGEKLVLALCAEARIETTKGTVLFERGENRRRSPKKTEAGSRFVGLLRLNQEERDALLAHARAMIVPVGKRTFVNGQEVFPRSPTASIESCYLETEKSGEDGAIRRSYEYCPVTMHEVLPGETAHLYEMGIPVVATGDRWHVDVGQKIPLNMERDNVSPGWLATLRAHVTNATRDLLTVEDANAPWARDALGSHWAEPETIRKLVALRFGDQAVVHDPNDQEANQKAASHGYTVVTGSQLSAEEWERVRSAGALAPSGQVFPTPKAFHDGGRPLAMCTDITDAMMRFKKLSEFLADQLTGQTFRLHFAQDRAWDFEGCIDARAIIINVGYRGRGPDWFEEVASAEQLEFLIHELAHTVEGNHLSDRYHDTLCKFGAKVARLAIDRREEFR